MEGINMVDFKKGDKVKVWRSINKNNSEQVEGVIIRLSDTILIAGEPTAVIQYYDDVEPYWHKLSTIEHLTSKHP